MSIKTVNRALGALVAAALAVIAVIVVIEVVAAQVDADPVVVDWRDWRNVLARNDWIHARPWLYVAAAAAAAVLLVQLWPRRPHDLSVAHDDDVTVTVRRRSLEHQLEDLATSIDGVSKAKARCRRRRLAVRARTNRRDTEGLEPALRNRVATAMDRLGIEGPPAIDVRIDQR